MCLQKTGQEYAASALVGMAEIDDAKAATTARAIVNLKETRIVCDMVSINLGKFSLVGGHMAFIC